MARNYQFQDCQRENIGSVRYLLLILIQEITPPGLSKGLWEVDLMAIYKKLWNCKSLSKENKSTQKQFWAGFKPLCWPNAFKFSTKTFMSWINTTLLDGNYLNVFSAFSLWSSFEISFWRNLEGPVLNLRRSSSSKRLYMMFFSVFLQKNKASCKKLNTWQ